MVGGPAGANWLGLLSLVAERRAVARAALEHTQGYPTLFRPTGDDRSVEPATEVAELGENAVCQVLDAAYGLTTRPRYSPLRANESCPFQIQALRAM